MRKEPFAEGNYVHVFKRGVKKLPIVRDKIDCWRFLKILSHCNDRYLSEHWEQEIEEHVKNSSASIFDRPPHWPTEEPLVMVLAYTLMPNHFHLLLKEITAGGVGRFMQKLGNSMTAHFNLKYKEVGSMFQGAYKAKCIERNEYMQYVPLYIMVKNVFELYPGGLARTVQEFDEAYAWATRYEFSSFADYASAQVRPARVIIEKEILGEKFPTPEVFKTYAREFMKNGKYLQADILDLSLEAKETPRRSDLR